MGGERAAVFAGLYAGVCFGIFWIPIRVLEEAGFHGPWAMVILAGLPFLICLPILWLTQSGYRSFRLAELSGGLVGGVAFALYATAFLYTDIVRVILMFYLAPAWGFLLGGIFLGDRMTRTRWMAMSLCFVGIYIVFGRDTGLPFPHSLGDWLGFVSGILWSVAALLILIHHRVSFLMQGTSFFATATLTCLLAGIVAAMQGLLPAPTLTGLGATLSWTLPLCVLVILPTGLATVFAPSRLNPGVSGLLFMTEVVVAAVTAAIWADEPLGTREIFGLFMIMSAGLVEPAIITFRKATKP